MDDLKKHREGWDAVQRMEAQLAQAETPNQGLQVLELLWNQFAPWIEHTESLFRDARTAHIKLLQARLYRLASRQ